MFEVSDTGIGIGADMQAQLFDYRKLQSGASHRDESAGLALAHKSARLMGGDLSVESAIACGSTFTLSLPYVSAPHVSAVHAAA